MAISCTHISLQDVIIFIEINNNNNFLGYSSQIICASQLYNLYQECMCRPNGGEGTSIYVSDVLGEVSLAMHDLIWNGQLQGHFPLA